MTDRESAPAPLVLTSVAWDSVNAQVSKSQSNREVYVPPISLFRWWARRPHPLIGSLLDAAAGGNSITVSDPFSGGGTVALEAARRGVTAYAQDLHPWPIVGLATALDGVASTRLKAATRKLLSRLEQRCKGMYDAPCAVHGVNSEVCHVFWVRLQGCPQCATKIFLYPYPLISVSSRRREETKGYFGCRECGAVFEDRLDRLDHFCRRCLVAMAAPSVSLLKGRRVICPNEECKHVFPVFRGEKPNWKPVLIQRLCGKGRELKQHFEILQADHELTQHSLGPASSFNGSIPDGLETGLLQRAGFQKWSDIFPTRQLRTLEAAKQEVDALSVSPAVRARLRLALAGAVEMAGFICRWDRYYPKAFEGVANHRFPALGLACETNLLAKRGRGTFRRRLALSLAAAQWCEKEFPTKPSIRVIQNYARRRRLGRGVVLMSGTSERQLPIDGTVDLVLTDPPYFDDVQYAELASLFLAAAQAFELISSSITLDLSAEAVVNAHRGTGVEEYKDILTRIFKEAHRSLKIDGKLILTFHNTDIRAWWALSRALFASNYAVVALAVANAENSKDHPKRGRKAFSKDLVIECVKRGDRREVVMACDVSGSEGRELSAAGLTLADCGHMDLPKFTQAFNARLGMIDQRLIYVGKPT